MKKKVFKKPVDLFIKCLFCIALMFICTTADSDFTSAYIIALLVNILLLFISGLLLAKYGRFDDDENE